LWQTGAGLCALGEGTSAAAFNSISYVGPFCQFVNCEWSLMGAIVGKIGGDAFFGDAKGVKKADGTIPTEDTGGYKSSISRISGSLGEQKWFGLAELEGNTQNNLYLSILDLCIPGVLQSLNQQRQIECRYAKCLRDDVPKGIPISACKSARSYSTCVYNTGNIMGAMPILSLYNAIINRIKAIVSNPFAIAGFALGWVCAATCETPPSAVQNACFVANGVIRIQAMVANVVSIKDMFKNNQQSNVDYCEGLG
jgi:hypothetical protein